MNNIDLDNKNDMYFKLPSKRVLWLSYGTRRLCRGNVSASTPPLGPVLPGFLLGTLPIALWSSFLQTHGQGSHRNHTKTTPDR